MFGLQRGVGDVRLSVLLCSILHLLWWVSNCTAQQLVTYPLPESANDHRADYPLALLKMCERESQQKFKLRPSSTVSQQGRSLHQLSTGKGVDIVWTMTTKEREASLLPIRIPIDKGLVGWRLLLIRGQDKKLLSDIDTIAELGKFCAVQGHDWPDVDIMKANSLKVTTGSTYEGLFKMISVGRAQYFPRSVSEVWPELNAFSNFHFDVQPSVVLHYPSAIYFFVNKKNQWLADTLEACLNSSIADGRFDELFQRYHGDAIARSNLERRVVITLRNPTLPEETPIGDRRYWFAPKPLF